VFDCREDCAEENANNVLEDLQNFRDPQQRQLTAYKDSKTCDLCESHHKKFQAQFELPTANKTSEGCQALLIFGGESFATIRTCT